MYRYYLLAVIVISIDQFTKYLVVKNMELYETIPIIDGFFYLTSHRNSGAAWGILQGRMGFFYVITAIVIIGIIYYLHKFGKENKLFAYALGLLLGGAIGNFIDRLFHQEVVDFADVIIFGYDNFPIFNVADSALTIGVILVIIITLLDEKRSRKEKLNDFTTCCNSKRNKVRIDKLLTDINPEQSRSQIQGWITKGFVKVNHEIVKANYKCLEGDIITWAIPEVEPLDIEPENIPLDIVYEDKDILVVNKKKGMVVHPSAGHQSGTLVNALLYHCDDLSGINSVERPGIVHRIDKDTSGLLVVAKNDKAHTGLSEQLSNKDVERIYEAVVHGVINHDTGIIDAPIGRDPKDRQKMGVVENGRNAVTHFQVVHRFKDHSHIECRLETGRTHQIRVHMRYIGFPLVGDPKYGPRKTLDTDGQALHAKVLGFTHPITGEWLRFEVEAPSYFHKLLETLEQMY